MDWSRQAPQGHKYFVPIDQQEQIVQLILYEAKNGKVSGFILDKQGCYLWSYLIQVGIVVFCS